MIPWMLLFSACVPDFDDPGAPVLRSFQGAPVDTTRGYGALLVLVGSHGDVIPLELEVFDEEGDPWRVYISLAPPGLELDPETGRGTWTILPGTLPFTNAAIWMQDVPERGDPSWSSVPMQLVVKPAPTTSAP